MNSSCPGQGIKRSWRKTEMEKLRKVAERKNLSAKKQGFGSEMFSVEWCGAPGHYFWSILQRSYTSLEREKIGAGILFPID